MATFGFLCRSGAQGREADRPAGADADQVPARSQSQDRQGAGHRRAGDRARPRRRGDRVKSRDFIAVVQRGGIMRSMTFCATVLSPTIATAVASAQTPSPAAAAPVASPADKQAISKACSDHANPKGLTVKTRKKVRSQ